MSLGLMIKTLMMWIGTRLARYEIMIFPYIMFFMYSKEDKEFMKNVNTIRNYTKDLVD